MQSPRLPPYGKPRGLRSIRATAAARGPRRRAGAHILAEWVAGGGLAGGRVGLGAGQGAEQGRFCKRPRRLGPRRGLVASPRRSLGWRHAGPLSLAELGKLAGGLDYAVVSKAIARFSRRLASDAALQEQLGALQSQLSK